MIIYSAKLLRYALTSTLVIGVSACGDLGLAPPVDDGGSGNDGGAGGVGGINVGAGATGGGGAGGQTTSTGGDGGGGIASNISIAAGVIHACALLGNGTVVCWGSNEFGELGIGTSGPGTFSSVPVQVNGLTDVKAIAAGPTHTCALLVDGKVKCWGENHHGQLGDGTLVNASLPVFVAGLSGVKMIAGAGGHSCALLDNSSIRCWGTNAYGQLGDGGISGDNNTATVMGLPTLATSVATADFHSCALLQGSEVWCWGGKAYAHVVPNSPAPTQIANLTATMSIATRYGHGCALDNNGGVSCWGRNKYGELGYGTSGTDDVTAVAMPVTGLTSARALSLGFYFGCVLLDTDQVSCWGRNHRGQLGDPSTVGGHNGSPTTVPNLSSVASVAAGGLFACAVLEGDTISCWGGNENGQLGNGDLEDSVTPVAVVGF